MSQLRILTASEQVAQHLRDELRRGTWTGVMPGEDRLMARLGVGRNTIQAALNSIPLLIAMQAGETTTRGRYYSEDTPIPEVHETLTEGGFTGYLELSENVLSGDYYVVYQAGRSGGWMLIETNADPAAIAAAVLTPALE